MNYFLLPAALCLPVWGLLSGPANGQAPPAQPPPSERAPPPRVANGREANIATPNTPESSPASRGPAASRPATTEPSPHSLQELYQAVARSPNDIVSLQLLAEGLTGTRKYEESIPIYHKLISALDEKSKARRTARFNLAVAMMRLGRLDQAAEHLRVLLSEDPSFNAARYNLALVLRSQAKLEGARRHLVQVTAQAAGLPQAEAASAYGLLGEVLMDLKQPLEAMKAYGQVAKLEPKSVPAWLNYAAAARAAGSYGLAIVAARQACSLAPNDAGNWRLLGELQLELYEATKTHHFVMGAMEAFRQSLKLKPDQAEVKALIEKYAPIVPGESG